MRNHHLILFRIAQLVLICVTTAQAQAELSGQAAIEWRVFPQQSLSSEQRRSYPSVSVQTEYYYKWDNGKQSFTITPFVRLDQRDKERTHFDVRELTWLRTGEGWELRLGVRKVFWGVTESQHLVDIINQTDLVEDPDGEEKLGQPMVNLAIIRKWGALDFFVMPYFRERTFPGKKGRLRASPPVATERATFESRAKRWRPDLAVRWSHHRGVFDIGLAHFYGTSREPILRPQSDATGRAVLIPHYPLIHQTSLDLQATTGSWLWKAEVVRRDGFGESYAALTAGVEYTFVGVFNSRADVGALAERLYDQRGSRATNPFASDLFLGARLVLNDVQNTEALAGSIIDYRSGAANYRIEVSRRLGKNWKMRLDTRIFTSNSRDDLLYAFRKDSFLRLELAYFF